MKTNSPNFPGTCINEKIRVSEFYIAVRLGNPESGCKNYGICQIEPYKNGEIKNQFQAAKLKISGDGNITLIFNKEEVSTSIFKKHFSSAFFKIETGFKLKKNQLPDLYIRKGLYPIYKNKNLITICFNP